MISTPSTSRLHSNNLSNGEYYVFSRLEGEKITLGYIYTTWCASPCGMHMKFSVVELNKPIPLVRTGDNQIDEGQLPILNFDSREIDLIDDVYNRCLNWLNKMHDELNHPHLDESTGCIAAIIVVKEGVLSAFYRKNDFLQKIRGYK